MATAYKVLGQLEYDGTGEDTLYTVPSATQAVCSTLAVCNRSTSVATFNVRVKINGEADANKQYVCFEAPIGAKDTLLLTFGATLSAADIVTVVSSSTSVTFHLFGSEIS